MNNSSDKPEACDSKQSAFSLLDNTVISRKKFKGYSHWKAIGSGKIIEIYHFQDPVVYGHRKAMDKIRLSDEDDIYLTENPEKMYLNRTTQSEEDKINNARKAKNKIRRLVQMNFDSNDSKLLTLTFKDTVKFDVTSLSACLPKFQYFIKKTRNIYPDIRYVGVPEFQDKNGRGAVHYHLMIRVPFIEMKRLTKLWRHGFVFIEKIYNHANVGLYIAKYFSKSSLDPRFDGHRKFYPSTNLVQPAVFYSDHLVDIKKQIEKKGFRPSFQGGYFSDHQGKVNYWSYNLYQRPAQETEKNGAD